MTIVFVIIGLVLLLFGLVVFVGAPYLPTLHPQVETAFELLALKKGQTLLELGCGDGKVLIRAAERGYKAVGIELNPILALVAWARTRRFGSNVQVIFANYWHCKWPESEGVFVFLIDHFMPKLHERMKHYPKKLVSVAFKIPDVMEQAEKNGVYLYDFHK